MTLRRTYFFVHCGVSMQKRFQNMRTFRGPLYSYCNLHVLITGKPAYCVTLASIHQIQTKFGWYYDACQKCMKKVHEFGGLVKCSRCSLDYPTVVARYKIHVIVVDNFSSASLVLFDKHIEKLIGKSASELKQNVDKEGDELSFPDELNTWTNLSIQISCFTVQH